LQVRRRDVIAGLTTAAAWPVLVRAQQGERVRRIGVLMWLDENDPLAKARISEFAQALADLGWADGRNVRMDLRWAGNDINRIRALAHELVGLQPDIIVATSTPMTVAVQRETRTIPIVFLGVSDPVASGLVARLDRPSGNITGFAVWEATLGGKWLELLLEIAPRLKRITIMFNPGTAPYVTSNYLPSLEAAARSFRVEPIAAPVHDDDEIANVTTLLGREPKGGLIVMPDVFSYDHRTAIISLARAKQVPAVYQDSVFARDGGLLSYGPNTKDIYHRAASYVDRILRGTKPAELPVQLPTKFEMAVNLKTAKALGLTIPPNLLAIADEVIE
jgi:putative tryptophan/tyrosine transport system substrate-binding protein